MSDDLEAEAIQRLIAKVTGSNELTRECVRLCEKLRPISAVATVPKSVHQVF